jgi:transcription elongation factor Elf1
MKRPVCPVCQQRPCAVNYIKEDVTHYRSRCENCTRKNKQLPKRKPRWEQAGYQKKMVCDYCGFKARYSAQMLVYHVDGRLDNNDYKNLKSVCKNCEVALAKSILPWRRGDLEADF